MFRWAIVLVVFGLLPLPAASMRATKTHAVADRSSANACAGFVQQFYNWYRPLLEQDTNEPAAMLAIKRRPHFFSGDLRKRLAEDRAAELRSREHIVGIDFDAFTGGSDFADRYVTQGAARRGQSYRVEVCGMLTKEKRKLLPVVAEVGRRDGRWIFLNFHYPGENGAASTDLLTRLNHLRDNRKASGEGTTARSRGHSDLERSAPFRYRREETLGKTEAQILAMGRDGWAAFFTEGDRDTSANQCAAQEIFGLALERRNRRRIATLPPERRRFLERLRGDLTAFKTHAIEALASAGGGGATWKLVRSGVSADVEAVIGRLIGDRGPVPALRRSDEVIRKMDSLERDLREAKAKVAIPTGEPYSAEHGIRHLRQARSRFQALVELLKKAPRSESGMVLGACIDDLEGKGKPFGG